MLCAFVGGHISFTLRKKEQKQGPRGRVPSRRNVIVVRVGTGARGRTSGGSTRAAEDGYDRLAALQGCYSEDVRGTRAPLEAGLECEL